MKKCFSIVSAVVISFYVSSVFAATPLKKTDNGYKGMSGKIYKYDLSRPADRVKYSVDPISKINDRTDPDPKRRIDQNMGQYGAGQVKD